MHYLKYINTKSGKTFVVNSTAKSYLEDSDEIAYVGICKEGGEMIDNLVSEDIKPTKVSKEIKIEVKKSTKQLKKEQEEVEQELKTDSFDTDDED